MKLAALIRELVFGQLRDLPFVALADGTVPAEHLPVVLNAYNGAMEALHQRFPIELKTLILETVDGIHQYPLRPEYAQTSSSLQPVKFIKDTAEAPFLGDVLAIERIFTNEHQPLALNERGVEGGWLTPAFDTLATDHPRTGDRFHIEFRAAPLKIDLVAPDLDSEVWLPVALTTALKLHIAYCVYSGLGMEGALSKAQGLYAAYENECARLERDNTLNSSMLEDTNQKFDLGGWI